MKKVLFCLAIATTLCAQAQQFEVVDLQKIKTGTKTQAFHPRFMPDGNLLVSEENYDGLGIVNVAEGTYTELTSMEGAGYYAVVSEDGKTILTRSMDKENFTQTIYKLDVASKALTPIAKHIEHVNQIALYNGEASYAADGKAIKTVISGALSPVRRVNDILVTEEDLMIVVYKNGTRTVLDPLAGQFNDWEPQYIWTSLSPSRDKILFGCADNAYVCNLDGSGVVKLGAMRSPKWRNDTHVVGMVDSDDGYHYTKSDIVIVKTDGTQFQQLTSPSNEIKMFPSVSEDGSKIAFHTTEGNIYIMTIQEK